MRLDDADAETLKNVRVQCLGEEYPATGAAFHCMNEVSRLRKEWHANTEDANTPHDDKALKFSKIELEYRTHSTMPIEARRMLGGFGLYAPPESPDERLQRFKHDLGMEKSWFDDSGETFKRLVRDVEKKIGW